MARQLSYCFTASMRIKFMVQLVKTIKRSSEKKLTHLTRKILINCKCETSKSDYINYLVFTFSTKRVPKTIAAKMGYTRSKAN